VDFLAQVERVYAIIDNLSTQRASDVRLFGLAQPRGEFVFQPKYAAYLYLIEPWWKVLRSWPSKVAVLKPGVKTMSCQDRN
jgi:hypothetical protein